MEGRKMEKLTVNQLKQLRHEIVLGSIYMDDYNNSFMSKEDAYNLFDGYMDYLGELMSEKIDGYKDNMYFDYFEVFDNIETLKDYYYTII